LRDVGCHGYQNWERLGVNPGIVRWGVPTLLTREGPRGEAGANFTMTFEFGETKGGPRNWRWVKNQLETRSRPERVIVGEETISEPPLQ